MCGIAGIVNYDGLTPNEVESLEGMAAVLTHRGPDGQGVETDQLAGLVHTRLSILDVAGGRQPMANETGSVWVTFNGEIYNHAELRRELQAKGHHFRTRCDTEVLVHLYEEEGEHGVERLRGMFAFAVWDRDRRRLLLARDRVGIKPLYYAHDGRRLLFGSELKALLQAPGLTPRLDPEALLDYLTLLWVPAPRTIFAGCRKLPAGHVAVFDEHGLRLRRYWDLHYRPDRDADPRQLADRLRAELRETVGSHLESDVPLGAFLSGGLDSSAVAADMAGLSERRVLTHAIGFPERAYDETPFAREVAERFRTDHEEHVVHPQAVDVVERLAWQFDEPFADASAIPCYYLAREARRRVAVALSGDGGDENFAGYRLYKFHARERWVRRALPLALRKPLFGGLGRAWPKADWLPRPLRLKATLQNLGASDAEAMFRSRAFLDPALAGTLLTGDLRSRLNDYSPAEVYLDHARRCQAADALNRDLYLDFKLYLADDVLAKVDRTSMAWGLEVRVPLLDHRFVEFAASLPPGLKLRGGVGKYLFKEALRPALGAAIVDRQKQGFAVPLDAWFRGPLRPMVEDTVFAPDAHVRSWLDRDALQALWRGHVRGSANVGALLWAVLMLEHWGRHYLAAPSARQACDRPQRVRA